MSKVKYDGITFDSDLEVQYYQYLGEAEDVVGYTYHPRVPMPLNSKNNYYPDFIVSYQDRIEIIETKGYSQFSFMKDNMIHNYMLEKSEYDLWQYLESNGFKNDGTRRAVYRKIKHLKAYGFVDWDFKNPNTIANKRKEKINDLSLEIKDLRDFKKKVVRFIGYQIKIENKGKLTKQQQAWYDACKEELKQIVEGEKE